MFELNGLRQAGKELRAIILFIVFWICTFVCPYCPARKMPKSFTYIEKLFDADHLFLRKIRLKVPGEVWDFYKLSFNQNNKYEILFYNIYIYHSFLQKNMFQEQNPFHVTREEDLASMYLLQQT